MPFVKILKTSSYYSRYQTKFRRRREGKTDYFARKKLIAQDQTKYNSPKYRLVVRLTNTDVICQIVSATLSSDVVLTAAYAHELPNYGLKITGLKNYAAAYATGLLVARRALKKLNLDKLYVGQTEADGKHFIVEEEEERRPFYVILDVGLRATTTGARVFAAMKGAADGGLEIPHNVKRFPGYNSEKKKFDSRVLRKYIFGGNIAEYMEKLSKDDDAKYQKQFSKYIKAGVSSADVEGMWKAVHTAIRAKPEAVKAAPKPAYPLKKKSKTNLKQKNNRVKQVMASMARA
eukprot:TRINITY_DN9018_c0_g1_i1.p2 TRINITY_DN9018_c0_g1~~TRINITY_DN9018_c0_g1_i1.p2  ORF type:complete len:306 (-),score=113.23 TRINITY_DN9018_c0_g1_i1:150-1019(-)